MLDSAKRRNSVVLLQIVLIVTFTLVTSYTGPPVTAIQSAKQLVEPFKVPVKIETYGNAWDGYLVFGFWDFPYGATNFSLTPYSYLVVMTTKGQLVNLRTASGINSGASIPGFAGNSNPTYAPVKYIGQDTLMLESYVRQIDGRNVLMDTIIEQDKMGNTLWTWDTYAGGHFNLKDECLCNATTVVNGQTVIDLTHANSLQWNFQTNMIY